MAHVLFQNTDTYGADLRVRQNLSMFTYVVNGTDLTSVREKLTEVWNVLEFPPIDRKAQNDEQHANNREMISKWWDNFTTKEAML